MGEYLEGQMQLPSGEAIGIDKAMREEMMKKRKFKRSTATLDLIIDLGKKAERIR